MSRPDDARRLLRCALFLAASGVLAARLRAQDSTAAPVARVAVTVVGSEGASQRPLEHALVRSGTIGAETDASGTVVLALPAGARLLIASRIGFAPESLSIALAPGADTALTLRLRTVVARIAGIVVTATRGEHRIQDEPTRVEVLAREDVGEKTEMRPANPTTLLSEIPGARVQSSSPALGGSGIRLQGLRGRYTLLLADGLPLYGASSEGLGFLQIPPLDLAQAEVIKGPATALYGPAALGGVVNLVSRRPPAAGQHERELLVNATSQGGADALLWSAGSLPARWGYTLIGGLHRQAMRDVSGDGWADVPGFRRAELRPRFFWTGTGGSSAMLTFGGATERRDGGGTVPAPAGNDAFPVSAATRRADIGSVVRLAAGPGLVTIRASANRQWQDRQLGDSTESDRRGTALAELSWARTAGTHELVVGAAAGQDLLAAARLPAASFDFLTTSLFAQDTYTPLGRVSLAASARLDHHSRYGSFVSPRLSLLTHLTATWSARLSAAAGMSAPTSLVEEADAVGLARERGFGALSAERIRYASLDVNGALGPLELNGTLYRSHLSSAVVTETGVAPAVGTFTLRNAPAPTRTDGAELFAVYSREPLAVTALYSFTRSAEWSPEAMHRVAAPLVPRHAGGLDVAFEEDETGTRVGLEAFYTGRQALADDPYRTVSVPYTTVGLLASQRIGAATVFVNAENLTNVRQTRFDPLLRPARGAAGAWTTEQWAPLDGRVINAGVRVSIQ